MLFIIFIMEIILLPLENCKYRKAYRRNKIICHFSPPWAFWKSLATVFYAYLFIPYLLGINDRNPFRVDLNKNKNLCRVVGMIQGTTRAAEHTAADIGNWEASGNPASRGSVLLFVAWFSWLRHVCMLSHSSRVQLFATLWTIAHQAPLSMEFSRQEYWSGLPCLPPRDLPQPDIALA